jgi:ribosome biogenesis protein BMS1
MRLVSYQAEEILQPRDEFTRRLGGEVVARHVTGEVRRDLNLSSPNVANSTYRPIERATCRFNSLRVPKSLQQGLELQGPDYADESGEEEGYLARHAVMPTKEESHARDLLQKLQTMNKES